MKHLIKIDSTPHGVLGVRHAGFDQQYCEAGEQVILKWQPDAKWGLQEAHYIDNDGNVTTIDLTRVKVDGVNVVAFVMPNKDITIGGTFKMFVSQDWTEGTNPSKGEVLTVGNNGEPTPISVDELANEIAEGDNNLVDSIDAINPFKGWYANLATLQASHPSPQVGDYAYVKGAESTDPAAIYECITTGQWSNSGRTADTSNVQTFASSQEVNEVHIVNDLTTGGIDDVLSAEQGKVLNEKVSALYTEVNGKEWDKTIAATSGSAINSSNSTLNVDIKSGEEFVIEVVAATGIINGAKLNAYGNGENIKNVTDATTDVISINTPTTYTATTDITTINLYKPGSSVSGSGDVVLKVYKGYNLKKRFESVETLSANIPLLVEKSAAIDELFVSLAEPQRGFVRWTTKEIESGAPGYDYIWKIFPKGQIALIYKVAGAAATAASVAFYSTDDESLANSDTFISGVRSINGVHEGKIAIPSNCKMIIAYNQNNILANESAIVKVGPNEKYLIDKTRNLESSIQTNANNIQSVAQSVEEIDGMMDAFITQTTESAQRGFVRWSTKEIETGYSFNKMWVIHPQGQKILKYNVIQADANVACVALYNTDDVSECNATTFIDGVQSKDGITEGRINIPATCKTLIVSSGKSASPQYPAIVALGPNEEDLQKRISVLEPKVTTLEGEAYKLNTQVNVISNPFKKAKFFGHLHIENVNRQCVIPLQSEFDIIYSKRLGFNYIEANVSETSDGKAIITHSNGGYFGNLFKLNPNSSAQDDIPNTLINTKTLAWIKENVVYNSSIPKFCVAPLDYEEFIVKCKNVGILPFININNRKELVDKTFGKDNYIADRLSVRGDFTGTIIMYRPSVTSKEDIIALCDSLGAPCGYTFSTNLGDYTDAELKEITDAMHLKGYLVGMVSCYQNEAATQRGWKAGFDYACSNYQVNDFGYGNLLNIDNNVDYNDFITTGTISDGILTLADGNTISPSNPPSSSFLSVGSLTLRFNGTIILRMGDRIITTLTSDGMEEMLFSTYYCQEIPTFSVTSQGTTTIDTVLFKASKV